MQRTLSIVTAALVAFAGLAATADNSAQAGNRGRAVAAGIVLGVAAAAIIANSNRTEARGSGYSRRGEWRARCNAWLRQCDRGNDYACEKFETRGCTE